ncbi:MAG: hypothetical protein GTN80_02640 [Nitrososphaeria archaeon]|nr:hypothetical protein [Nitrososphaeria archaeon]NIN52072.1 hypothetical protein [Nitrososphaeria archaeon]NIQ32532.1 hypothetical protein [Nitrososphaeria archaeon]
MPTHEERTVWGRGDASDLKVFETDIGNLGGLICYENHMTLLKYTMATLGEEIHCTVWPGWWRMERHPGAKSKVELGETDPTRYCDIDPCIREYAFETQTFVVSASGYLPLQELPEEYADVGFHHASGGCAVVNPAGLYIVDPVLNEEKIIYADLDMDDRRLTKAYFDAVGHYTRWDVVSLNLNQVSWTPLGPKNISLYPPRREVGAKELREIAEKFEIDLDKLEALIEELRTGATL